MTSRNFPRMAALLACPLLAVAMPLSAEETPGPPTLQAGHLYTLEELEKIGLANQPRIKASIEATRAAKERKGEAFAPYLPTVNAYAEYVRATYNNSVSTFLSVPWFPSIGGYSSVDGTRVPAGQLSGFQEPPLSWGSNDSYTGAVVAQYDIYDFGRRANGLRVAEAGLDAATADQSVVAEAVLYQIRSAYYGLLAGKALNVTAEKMLAEAKEHFTWAHEAVKDGLRPPVDELQAKADVTKAELQLVRAVAEVRIGRVRLLEAIGEEHGRHIDVAPREVPADIPQTEEALLDLAYHQRPDYAELEARRRQSDATVAEVNSEFLPRLWGQASIEVTGVDPGLPTSISAVPDWDIGAVLAIPIFEGYLTTHQAREAQAKLSEVVQQQEELKLKIIEQVREAFVDFKSALEAVAAADANQQAAEEQLHVVEGRYNNGLGSILDLIIAQATAVSAEDQDVRSRYQAGRARAFLDLAISSPIQQ